MGALGPPWVPATLAPPSPPAGGFYTATVPVGQLWHILSVRYTMASSAVAGTRQQYIYFSDAAGAGLAQVFSLVGQAPSFLYFVSAYPGAALQGASVNSLVTLPLPDLILRAGNQMQFGCAGLQAGDQYANLGILYEYLSYG